MKYSMYYSYKGIGDVLVIVFDEKALPTRSEQKDRITIIYHDDEIIGYNIFGTKDVIKIKSEGKIYLPSRILIDVVNSMLKNAGVPLLEMMENSGYFIGRVANVKQLDGKVEVAVTLNDVEFKEVINDCSLSVDDRVVINNTHICTNEELGIKENAKQITVLEKEAEVGKDFFSLEER